MDFTASPFLFHFEKSISIALSLIFTVLTCFGIHAPKDGCGASDHSEVRGSMAAPTEKIQQDELIGNTGSYDMFLAKREYEACQLVLKTASPQNNLVWKMTDFENDNGDILPCSVFTEKYINVSTNKVPKWYPDALAPFSGGGFSMNTSSQNQPFYIQVQSSPDTPAGLYKSTVTIINNGTGGNIECSFEITATVWNFTLPETPSCTTAMGLDCGSIAQKHGVAANSPQAQKLYEKYYEFLLSHKISPYYLPVDILSNEADKYMSDPRLTSFCIPYTDSDELLVAYYKKVTSNPIWAAKAYFYPIDEPSTADAYASYCTITDRLKRLCPGYHMVTPFYKYKFTDAGTEFDAVEQQKGRSDIICANSNLFDEKGLPEETAARVACGDRSWWYVCCGPKGDYCNLFTSWEGIRHRLLFWQQKECHVTGLLYWSTTYWTDVKDVWTDALTTPWTGNDTFGDGSLLYNGNKMGIDGPVPSFRLEAVTDGIEDYEYLAIAEKIFGEQYVKNTIARVSSSLTKYTYSDQLFASVREKLGSDINNNYVQNAAK